MLKQRLQNLKIVNTIKNNTVARGNNLKTRMFDNLSFTEIFETFDEEYLTYVAYENPEQLNRMCMFLSLDDQLRKEEYQRRDKKTLN